MKKHHFDVFQHEKHFEKQPHEKHFEKQPQPHFKTDPKTIDCLLFSAINVITIIFKKTC
jgi:hypothetical protein